MNYNALFVFALVAVVIALFAWAVASLKNASPVRPPKIGNINRKFIRRHMRRVWLAPLLIERILHAMGFTRAPMGNVMFANIGEGTFETGKKSYIPDASTNGRYLIYKIGSDADHVTLAGLNDVAIGVSDDQADTTNSQSITIKLFGVCPGMMRVQTDGTIANGNYVKAGANGQATLAVTGDPGIFGKALFGTDTSANAGDTITVVHDVPSKVAF
ncbi:MAG TPA: hypothetical protein VG347_20310 [Verrucomicrobiae bacterium]|nr:hypothetical protein [Verrucomicrobiae bacterium]